MAKKGSGDEFGKALLILAGGGLIGYGIARASLELDPEVQDPPRTPGELLSRLRAIVTKHHAHPDLRKLAHQLRQQAGDDPLSRIVRIDKMVRTKISNHPDPGGRFDHFASPFDTIRSGVGDCDDKAIFVATVLESDGLETAFLYVPKHVVACVQLTDGLVDEYEQRFSLSPTILRDVARNRPWMPLEVVRPELAPGQLMRWTDVMVRKNKGLLETRPLFRGEVRAVA